MNKDSTILNFQVQLEIALETSLGIMMYEQTDVEVEEADEKLIEEVWGQAMVLQIEGL